MLEGTYVAPEGSSKSMFGMLQMIGGVAVGVKYRMVDILITLQDYIQYWKFCIEKTSSSVSGIHFGHRNAAALRNEVVEIHAMMTQVVLKSRNPLTQWYKVLQVILQNISGNVKMEEQRDILLIEDDFNFDKKLYFGFRMIK